MRAWADVRALFGRRGASRTVVGDEPGLDDADYWGAPLGPGRWPREPESTVEDPLYALTVGPGPRREEPYDWADDANLGSGEVVRRFRILPPVEEATPSPWARAEPVVPLTPAEVQVRRDLDARRRREWEMLAGEKFVTCECWPSCRAEVDQGGPVQLGRDRRSEASALTWPAVGRECPDCGAVLRFAVAHACGPVRRPVKVTEDEAAEQRARYLRQSVWVSTESRRPF